MKRRCRAITKQRTQCKCYVSSTDPMEIFCPFHKPRNCVQIPPTTLQDIKTWTPDWESLLRQVGKIRFEDLGYEHAVAISDALSWLARFPVISPQEGNIGHIIKWMYEDTTDSEYALGLICYLGSQPMTWLLCLYKHFGSGPAHDERSLILMQHFQRAKKRENEAAKSRANLQ